MKEPQKDISKKIYSKYISIIKYTDKNDTIKCVANYGKPIDNCNRYKIIGCNGCKYAEVIKNEVYY